MANLLFYSYILFSHIMHLSFIASILILLILAIKKISVKRSGAKFQYLIWFIIILRLIMPRLPSSFFSIFNFVPSSDKIPAIVVMDKSQELNINNTPAILNTASDKASTILAISLCIVWYMGVLLLGIWKIYIFLRFKNTIDNLPPMDNDSVINMLEKCKKRANITQNIKIVQTDNVTSPSIIGFINPVILLPENIFQMIPENKINYIFLHELVHLKHYDILTTWLMLILRTLHWFNPIVQYAFNSMSNDMEIFCDSTALSLIKEEEVKEYGLTIINLASTISTFKDLPGAASILNSKCHIKRRIVMIKLFNKNSCRLSIAALAILATLCCTVLTDAKASSVKEEIRHGILNEPVSEVSIPNNSVQNANFNIPEKVSDETALNVPQNANNKDEKNENTLPDTDNSKSASDAAAVSDNHSDYITESELGTTISSFAYKGDTYNLPSEVRVPVKNDMIYPNCFSSYQEMMLNEKDSKMRHILIDWDKKVNTDTAGKYVYHGYVHGHADGINVDLTVYDPDTIKKFPKLSDVPELPDIPGAPPFRYDKETIGSDGSVSYYYLLKSVPDYQLYINPYNSMLERAGWKEGGITGSGSKMQFIYKKNQESITIGFGNNGNSSCFIVSGNVH